MNKITTTFLLLSCILFSCKNDSTEGPSEEKHQEIAFNLPEGFVLEDLYQPSENDQGSWVSLAQGPNNIVYACDQYGKIYYFNAPDIDEQLQSKDVHALDLKIGEAHGMMWAFNSLYVAVNKRWKDDVPDEEENGSGIYRITDNNHDGKLDKVEMLLKLDGAGEHGPHSFVLSPDGKEIYFIAGNHTLIPESVKENSRLPTNWSEDNLFEPYLDARGHANDIKAPGGWICKFNPEGTNWELISAGYRNPFDMAFNQDGELFAYDADMEWDIGMPWYRPTRICHVTSGSEYGWRTGSGKWPAYYPDALPAVHNLEQGSPTAVLSGAELNFPGNYKNGIFVMDWSFGTLYFADLKPKGSSYTAERKEFLSGTPLPLTDMIAGADGNLYFASGGRRIDSHLFRLRYTGTDSKESEVVTDTEASELRKLRQSLEKYHSVVSPEVILGNNVKVQNNVSIYTGVICEADVFLGPSMVFTNVINPRSAVVRKNQYVKTVVKRGASIGANATIVCGNNIGEFSFIGAGAVVIKEVLPYALVVGNPSKQIGWISEFGHRLNFDEQGIAECSESKEQYQLKNNRVTKL